uniref:(California timema) hypothetical protein n=1 Tax=Timema californicum TaxID=61474 RepID=A0A7R9J739_TIMCA|nr:unnamed protein product [Timema californicum]
MSWYGQHPGDVFTRQTFVSECLPGPDSFSVLGASSPWVAMDNRLCSQYSDLSSHFIPPFCTSSRKIVMNRWLESVEARLLSAGVIIPFMIGGSKAGEKHFPHLVSGKIALFMIIYSKAGEKHFPHLVSRKIALFMIIYSKVGEKHFPHLVSRKIALFMIIYGKAGEKHFPHLVSGRIALFMIIYSKFGEKHFSHLVSGRIALFMIIYGKVGEKHFPHLVSGRIALFMIIYGKVGEKHFSHLVSGIIARFMIIYSKAGEKQFPHLVSRKIALFMIIYIKAGEKHFSHLLSGIIALFMIIYSKFGEKHFPHLVSGKIARFMIIYSKFGEKHFSHLASISWRNTHICGASLISKNYILTAAHCFEDLLKREAWVEKNKSIWVFPGEELNKYQVKFGVNDLNSTYRVQNLPLRTVYIHPAFTPALLLNDIAVAQLYGEVQFSDVVRPACLSTEAGNNTSRATISGWGVTDTGLKSQSSQHMMHLSVDFTDPEDCINKYQLFNKNVTRRHKEKLICTKSLRDNHNACKGDSGGPLQTRSGCVFTVHGMVSHGAPEFSGSKHRNITAFCEGSHVIFTRVSYYLSWIEDLVWPQESNQRDQGDKVTSNLVEA